MTDVGPARLSASEHETLTYFYGYVRERLLAKLDGLDDATARRSTVDSGTNILGLAKHVIGVEVYWFHHIVDGQAEPDFDEEELAEGDTIVSVLAWGDRVWAESSRVLGTIELDAPVGHQPPDRDPMNNRWVLTHMIEEVARHAGHADIVREQLDGSVGR